MRNKLEPLSQCIEISLVWGIDGYHPHNKSAPKYSESFDFRSNETQNWLEAVVYEVRNQSNLRVRSDQSTFIEELAVFMRSGGRPGYPIPPDHVENQTGLFVASRPSYGLDLGTKGLHHSGRILYVRIRFRINLLTAVSAKRTEKEFKKWEAIIKGINSRAPPGLQALMVSRKFTVMKVELGILQSSTLAFCTSALATVIVVLGFTRNIILCLMMAISMLLNTAVLFGFLVGDFRWDIGAIQAIGLTTFVGMSVDYSLHVCHSFHSADITHAISIFDTAVLLTPRKAKASLALMHVGTAVLSGAITTAGSVVALMFCWMNPFKQLGVMILLNTCITLIYTYFFLVPLLQVCGPIGEQGEILWPFQWLLAKICRKKDRDPPPTAPSNLIQTE